MFVSPGQGLINLGNSCYLNSVLQCISQCHYLTHYLDISSRSGRKVSIDDGGKVRSAALVQMERGIGQKVCAPR